jgi:Flp pilus assembly protein TadB
MVKKLWAGLLSVFALLAGLFVWERSKRKEAEAKIENAEVDQKIAVLDERRQSAIAIAEVEKGRKLSTEELEEFLKNL